MPNRVTLLAKRVQEGLSLLDANEHRSYLVVSSVINDFQRLRFGLRENMQTVFESRSLTGAGLQELAREMLARLGEDPERDGLRDTPERIERSMQYLTKGYQENPEEILLGAMFDVA